MNIPENLKYSQSNEWIEIKGTLGTVGISDYAQDQLSDIVFAEVIVNEGDLVKKGDTIATIESVKAAADVYSPLSGKIQSINEQLGGAPEMINIDPYGVAWIVKLELSNSEEIDSLLDAGAYTNLIQANE